MEIEQHKDEFDKVIEKYHLKEKSGEIADFLTNAKNNKVTVSEFAKLFAMNEKDAEVFLSFIDKGLRFKEKTNI